VRQGFQKFAHNYFDAQFFAKFPNQTFLERLAGFTFATGKFPQAAEMRVGVALGDEKFSVAEDETGADFDQLPIADCRLPIY